MLVVMVKKRLLGWSLNCLELMRTVWTGAVALSITCEVGEEHRSLAPPAG